MSNHIKRRLCLLKSKMIPTMGGIDLSNLIITHRFSLKYGQNAYDMFDKKMDGCVKAIFYPHSDEMLNN